MSVTAKTTAGRSKRPVQRALLASATSAFEAGAVVLLTLHTPREKFWGALLDLGPAGVSVRGISLDSLAGCIEQLRAKERVDSSDVFFPMHRVERMEADAPIGEIPSIQQRFEKQTGIAAAAFFGVTGVQR